MSTQDSSAALRILQVSASDRMGGAERIAWCLHRGMLEHGQQSWLAVGSRRPEQADPRVLAIDNEGARSAWAKLWRKAATALDPIRGIRGVKRLQLILRDSIGQPARSARRWRGQEDFDFPASARLLELPPQRPDLVHAHNLHSPAGYFDLRELPGISRATPTMLTLHDAWLLSGHCAHSMGCDRWQAGCGACPDLSIYPAIARDATAFNWERKRRILAASRLYVATPSQWLMERVQQSILQAGIVEQRVIPNGVDLEVFGPGDMAEARRALDLPADAAVLLFAAAGIRDNCFKDFRTMRGALAQVAQALPERTVVFLALGEDAPAEALSARATLRFIPFEADERKVARFYHAADLYVHGARADTFPTTVLESLACGRAVVASSVGGIPEQVEPGETGLLVPPGDPAAMAQAIVALLGDPARREAMGQRAAAVARRRFDVRVQVERYLAWYRQIHVTSRVGCAGR